MFRVQLSLYFWPLIYLRTETTFTFATLNCYINNSKTISALNEAKQKQACIFCHLINTPALKSQHNVHIKTF